MTIEEKFIDYCRNNMLTDLINLVETQDIKVYINNNEPLRIAIINHNFEMTKYLLEKGADPNESTNADSHNSGYDLAYYYNYEDIINLLSIY